MTEPSLGERDRLAALRADGWVVAVHNDYRLNGEPHTFWLLTRGDRFVKGEGRTDAEALAICAEVAAGVPLGDPGAPRTTERDSLREAVRRLLALDIWSGVSPKTRVGLHMVTPAEPGSSAEEFARPRLGELQAAASAPLPDTEGDPPQGAEIMGRPVIVAPFTTHHKGEHVVLLYAGEPWLFWKHPDAGWVTECALATAPLGERNTPQTEGDPHKFVVDDKQFESSRPSLTSGQIMVLANVDPGQLHLFLEVQGGPDRQVFALSDAKSWHTPIDLPAHLYTMPRSINAGSGTGPAPQPCYNCADGTMRPVTFQMCDRCGDFQIGGKDHDRQLALLSKVEAGVRQRFMAHPPTCQHPRGFNAMGCCFACGQKIAQSISEYGAGPAPQPPTLSRDDVGYVARTLQTIAAFVANRSDFISAKVAASALTDEAAATVWATELVARGVGVTPLEPATEAPIWPGKTEGDPLRDRDKVWCLALLESGIDSRAAEKVLATFNALRPDPAAASLGITAVNTTQTIASNARGTPEVREPTPPPMIQEGDGYSVRGCRGHFHATVCGMDLRLDGDPFPTRKAAEAAIEIQRADLAANPSLGIPSFESSGVSPHQEGTET